MRMRGFGHMSSSQSDSDIAHFQHLNALLPPGSPVAQFPETSRNYTPRLVADVVYVQRA
jgi:hypothetical protein